MLRNFFFSHAYIPRANKKHPKYPYIESEAIDADDEKEEEETIQGSESDYEGED